MHLQFVKWIRGWDKPAWVCRWEEQYLDVPWALIGLVGHLLLDAGQLLLQVGCLVLMQVCQVMELVFQALVPLQREEVILSVTLWGSHSHSLEDCFQKNTTSCGEHAFEKHWIRALEIGLVSAILTFLSSLLRWHTHQIWRFPPHQTSTFTGYSWWQNRPDAFTRAGQETGLSGVLLKTETCWYPRAPPLLLAQSLLVHRHGSHTPESPQRKNQLDARANCTISQCIP